MNISEILAKQQEELNQKTNELSTLKDISVNYPDLNISTDRWHNDRYFSALANPKVTHVLINKSCGCCTDASWLARPYFEVNGVKVFSNPVDFYIGHLEEGSYNFHVNPDWKSELQKHHISATVIDKIGKLIDETVAKNVDDVEEIENQ